ncbi:hypothetical protein A3Q56_02720 [Intoshia linei]|uniref:Calcium homeostasis endoplasmic reticulum protein n=1 Tax=Intoshia linei TaxID=1819745 RepID=A0A177B5F6_9BILA|nr:hypothetical protein A3Q56_02720 [Intoshia linei]
MYIVFYEIFHVQVSKLKDIIKKNFDKMRIEKFVNANSNFDLLKFDEILTKLMSRCSKDIVQSTKKWIIAECDNVEKYEIVFSYILLILQKKDQTFSNRLHLLYLVNDISHYVHRKKFLNILAVIAKFINLFFSYTKQVIVSDPENVKLNKLHDLWKNKNIFSASIIETLHNVDIIADYENKEKEKHREDLNDLTKHLENCLNEYRGQHEQFKTHIQSQIENLTEKQTELKSVNTTIIPLMEVATRSNCETKFNYYHGVDVKQKNKKVTKVSKMPYYDTPAGLMVDHIPPESYNYKPLNTEDLIMPHIEQPDDVLKKAIEDFYQPDDPNNPRTLDGWNKNSLAVIFKKKKDAKSLEIENKSSHSSDSYLSDSGSSSISSSDQSTSITPPLHGNSDVNTIPTTKSESSAIKIMENMGWTGKGLGCNEQGQVDIVQQSEIRQNSLLGIGHKTSNNSFDEFRQNQSKNYDRRSSKKYRN